MSAKEHLFSSVAEQSYLETVICQYMPYVSLKRSTFVGSGVMGELFDPWGNTPLLFLQNCVNDELRGKMICSEFNPQMTPKKYAIHKKTTIFEQPTRRSSQFVQIYPPHHFLYTE